mmetsp:Transcript_7635/g.14046  ORF Transcript_7635/g.14046 Transcript_7635/m.14046 type:complete len:203 (+) Transcript_7635:3157-3765(+)
MPAPGWLSVEPTRNIIAPAAPLVALPVIRTNSPTSPASVSPVFSVIAPLTPLRILFTPIPLALPLAVAMEISPLLELEPIPERKSKAPPVPTPEVPPMIETCPPWPAWPFTLSPAAMITPPPVSLSASARPAVRNTSLPLPVKLSPTCRDICPLENPELPVKNSIEPDSAVSASPVSSNSLPLGPLLPPSAVRMFISPLAAC